MFRSSAPRKAGDTIGSVHVTAFDSVESHMEDVTYVFHFLVEFTLPPP